MKSINLFLIILISLFYTQRLYSQNYTISKDAESGNRYGYMSGNAWVNSMRFESAKPFKEGYAAVQVKKKWGYINSKFEIVYPFILDEAFSFEGGYAIAVKNGKWGMIDRWMGCAIPFKYEEIKPFSDGMAAIRTEKGWGFINARLENISQSYFEEARAFSEELAAVKKYGKWGYIDKSGKTAIAIKYAEASDFSQGLAAVKLNGKWGYIDRSTNNVIPYKYEEARNFSEGLAAVKLYGKWGFVDLSGKSRIPFRYNGIANDFQYGFASVYDSGGNLSYIDKNGDTYSENDIDNAFSVFAKQFVEEKVNAWQKKGKYEKTADWKIRVSEENRLAIIDSLILIAKGRFISEKSKNLTTRQVIWDYDADSEIFMIRDSRFGNLLVPVPIGQAESFEKNFQTLKTAMEFTIENDTLALNSIRYTMPDGKSFKYSNDSPLEFAKVDIKYNFDEINFDEFIDTSAPAQEGGKIQNINLKAGMSDVDVNIPQNDISNYNTFAVIIANENYQRESKVRYAKNDGISFSNYCKKLLGIPEKNIHLVLDATLNNIYAEIDWIKKVSKAYNGEVNIIFYYAGHGIPDEKTGSSYILPVDGYGSNTITGYKLSKLYSELSSCPAKSAVVLLDACFSGGMRDGNMMNAARGVAIKAKSEKPMGNLVVFSAAQEDETAYQFEEQGHGMFTYFLLKKLKDTRGSATLGELSAFVTEEVSKLSIVENLKSQTPVIIPSANLAEKWETMRLYGPSRP